MKKILKVTSCYEDEITINETGHLVDRSDLDSLNRQTRVTVEESSTLGQSIHHIIPVNHTIPMETP